MHGRSIKARYVLRFEKVLDFIDAHLEDGELDLERLSAVAAFSRFHFHRQFGALAGVSVGDYVQLRRMKRASWRLAFRDSERVVDIALGAGYETPEAFAKAFRKATSQTPSDFRREPGWQTWLGKLEPARAARQRIMQPKYRIKDVSIVQFPATRVAVLEHRGDPATIGDSIRRFIAWRRQNQLPPRVSNTFNVLYDDPATTPPAAFRLDLCAAVPDQRAIEPGEQGIIEKCLPAGRCALLRHTGSDDGIGAALLFLYAEWLPQSGEEPRDEPPFLRRVSFFPDVAENEAVTEAYLPLR
jgi:AraC family transcriptional regulator